MHVVLFKCCVRLRPVFGIICSLGKQVLGQVAGMRADMVVRSSWN